MFLYVARHFSWHEYLQNVFLWWYLLRLSFNDNSLSNFQVCSTVLLLTIVTMLYLTAPWLTYFVIGSLCLVLKRPWIFLHAFLYFSEKSMLGLVLVQGGKWARNETEQNQKSWTLHYHSTACQPTNTSLSWLILVEPLMSPAYASQPPAK